MAAVYLDGGSIDSLFFQNLFGPVSYYTPSYYPATPNPSSILFGFSGVNPDGRSYNTAFNGSGFSYGYAGQGAVPTADLLSLTGTISSAATNPNKISLLELSVDAAAMRSAVQAADYGALQTLFFGGNDRFYLSQSGTVFAGAGDDFLDGHRANFGFLYGEDGNDTLIAADVSDRSNGLYTAIGNRSFSFLSGGNGNDVLLGGRSDDWFDGGSGADFVDGGAGVDIMSYASSSVGVERSLVTGLGTGDAAGDVLFNVEGLAGSAFDDIFYGNHWAADGLSGGAGNDTLWGYDGDDVLLGGDGSDLLVGGIGADYINGGSGIDTISYRDAAAGVAVEYAVGDHNLGVVGDAFGDDIFSVENIWGSDFSDDIQGNILNNELRGYAGNDVLSGLAGNDLLQGGAGRDRIDGGVGNDLIFGDEGRDTLTGGIGSDMFAYTRWESEGGDIITDFESGVDKMGFSSYWFGIPTPGAIQPGEADFVTNGVTSSFRPTFLWDEGSGALNFDPDGLGLTAAVSIATFSPGTTLLASDLWVA